MTINPDFVLGAEFGDADGVEGGDDGAEPTKYGLTMAKDWTMHVSGGGHHINPVPYTGEAELFGVKLAAGDLEKMCDAHDVIRYHLVFEWLLPTFGKEGFYEFVAERM